jgi:3-hydroxybutyryl-CoA dehydrogenase
MDRREKIACVSAGRMGRGIAIVFSYPGHDITIVDAKARPADA